LRHVPLAERLYRYFLYWQLELRFAGLPGEARIGRMAEAISLKHLARQVAEPRLRQLLTPDYPIGWGRALIADDYYPALQRANVELVTAPIERLTEDGSSPARGAAGPRGDPCHRFETKRLLAPMTIVVGRCDMPAARLAARRRGLLRHGGAGLSEFLPDVRAQHQSRNLGHNSIISMIECQAAFILRCLRRLLDSAGSLELEAEAMARYQARPEREIAGTV
jgi:hypothetical protein